MAQSIQNNCIWQITEHPNRGHESREVWSHASNNPWRNLRTCRTEQSTWTPTCLSTAGTDWGPALLRVNHPDIGTCLGCTMHQELPWSLSHRSGRSPCALAFHRRTWTLEETPPSPHGWWLLQSNCWRWPRFEPATSPTISLRQQNQSIKTMRTRTFWVPLQ